VPLWAFGPMIGDFFDWRKESRSFSSLALFMTDLMNMAVDNNAVRVNGSRVTGDFFQLLGISPAIGRGVEPGDDDPEKPEVAVISYALWRSRFGADPDLLGQKLLLNAIQRLNRRGWFEQIKSEDAEIKLSATEPILDINLKVKEKGRKRRN